MGRIYLSYFYTTLVEHCLCVVLGGKNPFGLSHKWISFTTKWIEELSESDKEFIKFVFKPDFYNAHVGLACYNPDELYDIKLKRLSKIERDFAIKGGLIDIHSDEE